MSKLSQDLFNLKDKVVIISGGNGFLGRQFVRVLNQYGANTVILDLNRNGSDEFLAEIKNDYNTNPYFYHLDITNEKEVSKVSGAILEKYGRIDSLINNAALNPDFKKSSENFSKLENFELLNWEKEIAVGLTGAFLCSKYFGSVISKNKNGGSIINISSDLGIISPDQRLYNDDNKDRDKQMVKPVTYSVIKHGIIGLTKYLATYWCDRNVRCNAICPGGVENGQSEEFIKKISTRIPLGRMARHKDLDSTLVWMLCDSASYLNGAVVPVDGGRSIW